MRSKRRGGKGARRSKLAFSTVLKLCSSCSSLIINVRLSLASMARVSCKLQGDFWLEQGKRDRKSGILNAAVRSLKMADREYKRGARAGEAERSVWRER